MQKFANGVMVRVISLQTTGTTYGVNSSMYVGEENKVRCYDGAYQLENAHWYKECDLELVEVSAQTKSTLIIEDFEIGDTVKIVSLEATEQEFGEYFGDLGEGDTFLVEKFDTSDDSVYCEDDGNWFCTNDLELVTDVNTIKEFDIGDVEIGDKVRIVSLERSQAEFDSYDLEVGNVFIIDDVDYNDDSVMDENTCDWYFISELELIKDEVVLLESDVCVEAERDINFLITKDSVTLTIDGDNETATKDHQNFTAIREHVLNDEFDEAMSLMNISVGIQNWGQGSLQIQDGKILYVGMELTGKLVDRIIEQMMVGDNSFERFAKFLNKAMEQQSFTTRARIMDFAAAGDLEIDEDGNIIAYKNVRHDFKDKHSSTYDYSVGATPSMARHLVDDDHTKTCSQGLHICSINYLKGFWGCGGKTVRVKVDPRDMVGIPFDYADSKARVCKMEVIEDISDRLSDFGL